jgi:endo-alpha-1,4-polygalactosaminidase (GH114 family)
MGVQRIHDEGQTLQTPTGKVIGVVDSRAEFDRLAQALTSAGFLDRIDQFFFSDMEERVLSRHIEELKAGHFIILIEAASDRRDEAVRVATQNGARRLVHFGHLAITWLTK